MSIMSAVKFDRSAQIAKRYAELAVGYIDAGGIALVPGAGVPIENLIRLMEMLRYDAFEDELHAPVLALSDASDACPTIGRGEKWHVAIEAALKGAIQAYYRNIPLTNAIDKVEGCLRALANRTQVPPWEVAVCRSFLATFAAAL